MDIHNREISGAPDDGDVQFMVFMEVGQAIPRLVTLFDAGLQLVKLLQVGCRNALGGQLRRQAFHPGQRFEQIGELAERQLRDTRAPTRH